MGDVYLPTGNPASRRNSEYTEAIGKLTPGLTPCGRFQIPPGDVLGDSDFGGSATLFGSDVGACNKNGLDYVVKASNMALEWSRRSPLIHATDDGHTATTSDESLRYG